MNRGVVAWIAGLSALLAMACGGNASVPLLPAHSPQELIEPPPPPQPVQGAVLWGTVKELTGSTAVIALRDNRTVNVDFSEAQKAGRAVVPTVGENVVVNGTIAEGTFRARLMYRAKGPTSWGDDKPE
jgi:hypothetical protein